MNSIIIIAIAVGTIISMLCTMYCVVYCFSQWKFKDIKPLVIENPTLRDITEKRNPTLSYYKQNIITNNLI